MAKRPHNRWWILVLIILAAGLYLNRAYAYFFDFLNLHSIQPPKNNEQFTFNGQGEKQTYVALGDSLSYGIGVSEQSQTFPFLVAQSLSRQKGTRLINLSIPGATAGEVIKIQLPKLKNLNPNVITLLIGINDANSIQTENAFKKNYQNILEQITTNPETKVIVINIPAITNSKSMLPPYKYLVDLRIVRFNSIIDNLVAVKKKSFKNLFFVNLYEQTKDRFATDPTYFSEDYFHPSAKGYKLWSEIIDANLNQ